MTNLRTLSNFKGRITSSRARIVGQLQCVWKISLVRSILYPPPPPQKKRTCTCAGDVRWGCTKCEKHSHSKGHITSSRARIGWKYLSAALLRSLSSLLRALTTCVSSCSLVRSSPESSWPSSVPWLNDISMSTMTRSVMATCLLASSHEYSFTRRRRNSAAAWVRFPTWPSLRPTQRKQPLNESNYTNIAYWFDQTSHAGWPWVCQIADLVIEKKKKKKRRGKIYFYHYQVL